MSVASEQKSRLTMSFRMLWKIDNGPHRILGSIHRFPKNSSFPSWAYGCDVGMERIVFESDHRHPSVPFCGIDRTCAHLEVAGAQEIYSGVNEFFATNGINLDVSVLRPWKAAFAMSEVFYRQLNLEEGADAQLRAQAENIGTLVAYLEHPTHFAQVLDPTSESPAVGFEFLRQTLADSISGHNLMGLKFLIDSWFQGNLGAVEEVRRERISRFPEIFEALLHARNRAWIPVAKNLVHESVPTLFVVGVMHTVGPESFLALLAKEGIQVTRLK
jgi:uncharacterized protein YbaP (TraB family)